MSRLDVLELEDDGKLAQMSKFSKDEKREREREQLAEHKSDDTEARFN